MKMCVLVRICQICVGEWQQVSLVVLDVTEDWYKRYKPDRISINTGLYRL